jgi:DNA-binding NarL/FixJ family response regulator
MSAPIRMLIADDSDCVRRAIGLLLAVEPGICLCGEAATYADLVNKIIEVDPQVVLMDLHMPDQQEFDCAYLKGKLRRTALLAMSAWSDEATANLADSYGAVKLLDKGKLATTLMPAVEECLRQEVRAHSA